MNEERADLTFTASHIQATPKLQIILCCRDTIHGDTRASLYPLLPTYLKVLFIRVCSRKVSHCVRPGQDNISKPSQEVLGLTLVALAHWWATH